MGGASVIADLVLDGGRGRADVIADLRVDAVGGANVIADLRFGRGEGEGSGSTSKNKQTSLDKDFFWRRVWGVV